MSTALHQLTISEISCRNLRSADMFGKNDVYVVFRVGTKKVKTHHKKNAGKHATFDEIIGLEATGVNILTPITFAALFVGAMLPYWRTALPRKSVGRSAPALVMVARMLAMAS